MSSHKATISWQRGKEEIFTDKKYSRMHSWTFEGGIMVPASPSHHVVPLPYSNPDYVDPEQAFVAALSSCHMLCFLNVCSQSDIIVDNYIDNAEGFLERTGRNQYAMTKVILKPEATYSGNIIPNPAKLKELHHKAHEMCFIANSVTTDVVTEVIS